MAWLGVVYRRQEHYIEIRYSWFASSVPSKEWVKGSVCMGVGCFGRGILALLFVCGTRRPDFGRLTVGLGTRLAGLLFLERLITCDLSERSGTMPCPYGSG